jgi:hypothetical protein
LALIFINNEAPRPICIGGKERLQLVSGINQVDQELWEQAKKIAVVQTYLSDGTLKEPRATRTEEANLKGVAASEAMRLIKETFDPRTLARWAEGEKRAPIAKAIEAQLAAVEKATKPRDEEKGKE